MGIFQSKGDQGEKGDQGPRGQPGPVGPKSTVAGPRGPQGETLVPYYEGNVLKMCKRKADGSPDSEQCMGNNYQMKKGENIVINLSGRGDKDLNTVAKIEGIEI